MFQELVLVGKTMDEANENYKLVLKEKDGEIISLIERLTDLANQHDALIKKESLKQTRIDRMIKENDKLEEIHSVHRNPTIKTGLGFNSQRKDLGQTNAKKFQFVKPKDKHITKQIQ